MFSHESFSWPCLHTWLETKPTRQVCPVCKAAISRDKVIPLYGRGSDKQDPRFEIISTFLMIDVNINIDECDFILSFL